VNSYAVKAGEILRVSFSTPSYPKRDGAFAAFGGWFTADVDVDVEIDGQGPKYTLAVARMPNWGKIGEMRPTDGKPLKVTVEITAQQDGHIAIWGMNCGLVRHEFLDEAEPRLLSNMFATSPEANFYVKHGVTRVERASGEDLSNYAGPAFILPLKQCNRCARFLPINTDNERITLSFSNHCVAHRPCKHKGFGRLVNVLNKQEVKLDYGYQLECRFCKKFTVNAAHNKQRTPAQMKEDGARRRHIEPLLRELTGRDEKLLYRCLNGVELTDAVWKTFKGKCFKCGIRLASKKEMQLDHTRPLALLWPIDGSATALCKSCNNKKRDRPPSEFYQGAGQLERLSALTGISLHELSDPTPNIAAVEALKGRLDWFFDDFLHRPELERIRDGKTAGELLVKALQKTINKCPKRNQFDLAGEFARRRTAKQRKQSLAVAIRRKATKKKS
jgi:5-methylcytosine-specific restriction endonuclease McrA